MSPMTNSSARKRHTESTTPKENPMVTIATPPQVIDDLHAIRTEATTATSVLAEIRDLLDERLPVVHPGGQSNELNNDDPDEALAQVLWDHVANSDFEMHDITRTTSRALARIAREHITDWRADEVERLHVANRDLMARVEKAEAEMQAARADRDTWEAAYKRADDAYSRARDERDVALANQQASDAALAEALEDGHEVDRLRAGIQEQIDRSEVAADAWTVQASELRHLLDQTEGDQS